MNLLLALIAFDTMFICFWFLAWFYVLVALFFDILQRYGLGASKDEMIDALVRRSYLWDYRIVEFFYVLAFPYYCIPVALYQRYVKHNHYASLSCPNGELGRWQAKYQERGARER